MLENILRKHHVILGSKSPRRKQFLKELNISFESRTIYTPEVYPEKYKEEEITEFLADLKCKAIQLTAQELLITADTIVWSKNKALEKPKDHVEAYQMLSELSGSSHQVITSVCLATTKKKKIFTDKTTVYFKQLTSEEINYYIENYKPYDKAGGYGIQEWIGLIGVTKIEGSYANVVGIPAEKLYNELKNF